MTTALVSSGTTLWYLARGSGIVALLLLTASLCLGILTSMRWSAKGAPRFVTGDLHRNVSLLSLVFLAIHIASVVVDGFAPIGWLSAFVPFVSPYRPIWLGLGAVVTDLMLAVAITSGLRRRMSYRTWRLIHLASYLCWPIAALHSVGTGSDASRTWMLAVLAISSAAVIGLLVWRVARGVSISGRTRALAGVGAVVSPLLVVGLVVIGPLQPRWASRAGTPAAVLRRVNGARTSTTTSTPAAQTPGTVASQPVGSGFSARLAGSIVAGQGEVTITAALRSGATGSLSIVLIGDPLSGGGIQLRSGTVTVVLAGGQRYTGPVTGLSGGQITATVSDAAGTSYPTSVNVTLPGDGTVRGQIAVGSVSNARRSNDEGGGDGG